MFSIFSQKKVKIFDIGSHLMTDMHAHWIPGIDDGAKGLEETREMFRYYQTLGYKKLIATPHIFSGYYPNTSTGIKEAFDKIDHLVTEEFNNMVIEFAAEYFMDDYFKKLIDQGDILTLKSKEVLVEQSYFAESPGIEEIFFQLQIKGYTPVLAHPERYTYYHQKLKKLESFKDRGIKLQINATSISGKYGREVAKTAEQFLENDWVDYIGTDAHHLADLISLKELQISPKAGKNWEKCMNQFSI